MKPTLLCYNLSGERGSRVRFAAMRLGILLRNVDREEYGQPLEALCGLSAPEETPETGEAFEEEMLVMAGFPAGMLEALLQSFRRMKLAPIALKAVLTDTNRRWSSYRLHQEIDAERRAMEKGGSVHQPEER